MNTDKNVNRKDALNRRRRVIFNNDGCDALYMCSSPDAEKLLQCRTTPLVDTHVDSIFYCTISSGFGMFTHNTEVGQVFSSTEDIFENNITGDLIAQGTDPLQIMVDFCRENGMEIFWSMRMNDTHDGSRPIMFNMNDLKRNHPEYLVGSKEDRPPYGQWSAVDYQHPEIRDLAFQFVEEVCEKYDVDGVELDFFRHPVFFQQTTQGSSVGQRERDMMTEMMQRIRRMTESIGRRRKAPLLIAVRTPDDVEYCRRLGIDIEEWMEKDLIDIYIPSGYIRLNTWEYSVELSHRYGVKVYAGLSESRVGGGHHAHENRSSDKCYRARAMNVWDAGADGVYIFNLFDPHRKIWKEMGEPGVLKTLDKVYFPSVRGVGRVAGGTLPHEDFINISTLNPEAPLELAPGGKCMTELRVGEDVEWWKDEDIRPELKLYLYIEGLEDPKALEVKFNGSLLKDGEGDGIEIKYDVNPATVTRGYNKVGLEFNGDDGSASILEDIELWVKY